MSTVELATAFPAAATVGARLREAGLTVGVGESCTGGLLGAVLTSIPGSSAWVKGGVIAYSNVLKIRMLGVDPDVLVRDGAVSEAVAEQMARGARVRCHADIGIGITGIAGPDVDGSDKPVGLIYVCALLGAKIVRRRLEGDVGREGNRAVAVTAALDACAELLA